MPANTPGESAKREAVIMAPPSPTPPIFISATMATIRAIGRATCIPVMICGSAAGNTTSCSNSRSLAPRLRADHRSSRSTASVAAMVAVTTGKIASNTTIEIFERSWKPSQSVMIGRKAIFGIGNPTEMSGSKSQCIARLYVTAKPRATPAIAATAKPVSER